MEDIDFGKQLIAARKSKGLTQEDVAEKCNVTTRTIQRIESGAVNPRASTMKLIAEALDINLFENSSHNSKLKHRTILWYLKDLFNFKTTGLRFFTAYGPWGRPDMALYMFTKNIIANKPIQVFNNGNMERDFTYIDDIVTGIVNVIDAPEKQSTVYKIYNIGNSKPVKLMDFIKAIETTLGKKAIKTILPMQPGEVEKTWADLSQIKQDFNYQTKTGITEGVAAFIKWYKNYYH